MGLRLGGGWYNCLKKSLTKHSNLFLPFGKVRMGYPTWNVRMGLRPRVGADAIRLVLIFCHYTCGLSLDMFARWWRIPSSLHRFLSRFWASTLPKWGKHVTQQGQARCPTWAHFLLLPCPISHFFITPISSFASTAKVSVLKEIIKEEGYPIEWIWQVYLSLIKPMIPRVNGAIGFLYN